MKLFLLLIIFSATQCCFPQNSPSDSLRKKIPFHTNKIKESVYLSKSSEVFSYDSLYVWSDKRSLSEVMDERPGFFINDFGLGGRNTLTFNGMPGDNTGVYRDGVQMNDMLFGDFDIQGFSINEIERIEEISEVSSFFYGIHSSSKAINIITKDRFTPLPFTQLRFSQDREGSLFADVYYSQSFSRKTNLQLGITKHSLDGRYVNSDFNIWRGRGRLNFFLSPRANVKLNFYINNYDRGLNNGLIYSSSTDSLSNEDLAKVVLPNTKENIESYFYNTELTFRLFKNNKSLTKLNLSGSNFLRKLNNPDSLTGLPSGYIHTSSYISSLTQSFNITNKKSFDSDLMVGADFFYNAFNSDHFDGHNTFKKYYYSLRAKYEAKYNSVSAGLFLRNDNIDERNFFNLGFETSVKAISKNSMELGFNAGVNRIEYSANEFRSKLNGIKDAVIFTTPVYLIEGGMKFSYRGFFANITAYRNEYETTYKGYFGSNATLGFINKNIDITSTLNYSEQDGIVPKFFAKSDWAFKGKFFRNKLDLKTGFNFKYYNILYIVNQDQTSYSYSSTSDTFPNENQFVCDYYLGARIGKAYINLTVANIFNSLVYNTYIFPLNDREGFLNSISRFTIVWDFIN